MAKHRRAAPHYQGQHKIIAQRIRNAAYANPLQTCAICGNTLDKCGPRGGGRNRNGSMCTWDAGHVVPAQPQYGYRVECSYCNRSKGAAIRNAKRVEPHSERWW